MLGFFGKHDRRFSFSVPTLPSLRDGFVFPSSFGLNKLAFLSRFVKRQSLYQDATM
ncbi:hypothetical protein AMTRI_Chr03g52480 [Amborella trichopoda]